MAEDLPQISNFISLLLEDCVIMFDEGLDEEFFVEIIDLAKSLGKEAKEILVDPFHHTAL